MKERKKEKDEKSERKKKKQTNEETNKLKIKKRKIAWDDPLLIKQMELLLLS